MANKKYHNEDWLCEHYVEKEWTLKEMAEECGVSHPTIADWMDKHGIERRGQSDAQRVSGDHTDSEWLRKQYHDKKRTLRGIAEECGVNPATIMNWMDRHNIPRRKDMHHKKVSPASFLTEPKGYERVSSKHDGVPKYARVHQLIAIAEGTDPHKVFSNGEYHVHHKNGIKWDNRPDNLEFITGSEHLSKHYEEREKTPTGEVI